MLNSGLIWFTFIFYGYHRLAEGALLITEIKSNCNNFRLSTNNMKWDIKNNDSLTALETKFKTILSLPAPYEIRNGVRFWRNTDKLVSENFKILVTDNLDKKLPFYQY
jgi:hypothetical protein